MSSDRLVTAQHVLRSVMELRRRGSRAVLSELEALEPDLAEHLLESLTELYHRLLRMGLSTQNARQAHRRAESLALVGLLALRRAHHELWREDLGSPCEQAEDDDLPPEFPLRPPPQGASPDRLQEPPPPEP